MCRESLHDQAETLWRIIQDVDPNLDNAFTIAVARRACAEQETEQLATDRQREIR